MDSKADLSNRSFS